MRKPLSAAPITLLLAGLLVLEACGTIRESRLNPFNWFGRSTSAPSTLAPAEGYVAGILDNRALVDQVLSLSVEPVPGGAVVRATGQTTTQGWWDVELVADNDGEPVDGVLAFQFRVAAPRTPTPVSTARSREVTAATAVSDVTLAGVREIRVIGTRNERTSRR